MKEIIFKTSEDNRRKGKDCPNCGGETRLSPMSCPDGRTRMPCSSSSIHMPEMRKNVGINMIIYRKDNHASPT